MPGKLGRQLASVHTGDHLCILYRTQKERLALVAEYLHQGLTEGERCIAVCNEQPPVALRTALLARGVDVERETARNALRIFPAQTVYFPGGAFDPEQTIAKFRDAAEESRTLGFRRLRVTGDMRWALQKGIRTSALTTYEAVVSDALEQMGVGAACQYDLQEFPAEMIRGVLRTHTWILLDGCLVANNFVEPVREVLGEQTAEETVAWMIDYLLERNRTENALRESEARYHSLFIDSMDAIFLTGVEGTVIDANPSCDRLFGYEPGGLIGTDALERYPDETARKSLLEVLRASGTAREFETVLLRRDGTRIVCKIAATAIKDSDNRVVALQGIVHDVSDLRRTEERLTQTMRALRTRSEAVHALLWSKDEKTLADEICRVIVEEGGYRLAWVGYAENDPERSIRPMGQAGFEEGYLETLDLTWADSPRGRGPSGRAIRDGIPVAAQHITTDPDFAPWRAEALKRGYQSSLALPLRQDGAIIGMLAIYDSEPEAFDLDEVEMLRRLAADLSFGIMAIRNREELSRVTLELRAKTRELTRSEAYYRTLFERSSDIVTILDEQGINRLVSPSVERVLGYAPEDLLGRSGFGLVHPEDHDRVIEAFRTALAEGVSPVKRYRYRRRDDSWCYLESYGTVLLDDPAIRGIVINSRDVTEKVRLEDEREELEQQFRQSQKMEAVGRLAGGIAHDFNNLLTVILGRLELLQHSIRDEDPIAGNLKQIERAARHAAGLTSQLLAFSRKQVLRPSHISLGGAVSEMEEMLRRITGEDIDFRLALQDGELRVHADPMQIKQVLLNLIVNARDAMPSGGRVTIETRPFEIDELYASRHAEVEPGDYVALTVSDSGPGIPAALRERIFEPFFTTKEEGTGLGLATTYGIIRQSGGYIWLYSEEGRGTTFKILLPVACGEIPGTVEGSQPADDPLRTVDESILVVEDEDDVRDLAVEILMRRGYRVISAGDGLEAIQLVSSRTEPLDLLLTDVVMPHMTGRELADTILRHHPETRVLFMSGYTDNAIVHHGVLDEGTVLLEKPFAALRLLGMVREVLDEH